MDVTPELLEEFDFRRKGRGYDPEQVDELLSRAAATLADVTSRLEEQRVRADEAEATVAETLARSRTDSESDETIQRTLLLAQRTADAAVQEAEEAAGRKVAEASEEARRLIAEAEGARSESLAAAEDEVRSTVAATRERLMQEIDALQASRDALMGDVEQLERHLESERDGIRASIESISELLRRSERLGQVDLPELSDPPARPEPSPEPPPAGDASASWQTEETVDPPPVDWSEAPAAVDEPGGGQDGDPDPGDESADFARAWSETEEGSTAPPPPPPPPPQPDLGEVAPPTPGDDPPPPPPPPPGFDPEPESPESDPDRPATLDEAIGGKDFGGLEGDELAAAAEDGADDDNAWLAELEEEDAGRGGRRRFRRRD